MISRREILQVGAFSALSVSFGIQRFGEEFDVAIVGGTVIDPETKTRKLLNVGIRGGSIASLSPNPIRGKTTLDARGLVITPGFIDPIAHGQDEENDRLQLLDGVTTKLQMEVGVSSQTDWHKEQVGKRFANYGAGCSHTLARVEVFGDFKASETAVATKDQVAKMTSVIERELKLGALGVGFGLEYQPSSTRWEVIEMFQTAGRFKASCHCHTRHGTLLESEHNLTAVQEVISNALVAGAPLHICHVPSMALGNTQDVLTYIERAQARGLDVTSDFYPYTAFGTGINTEVFAPGWQQKFGMDFGDLEWAATHERLTAETFAKYRKEDGMVIAHGIPESAVQAAVISKATMIGSDGGLEKGVGHPRSAGTFARVLGHYARDLKLISLEEAVAKATIMTARRFEKRCRAFTKKGRVKVGADADLVIFDPAKILDKATFAQPAAASVGIQWVLLGGKIAVDEGRVTEAPYGKPIRA